MMSDESFFRFLTVRAAKIHAQTRQLANKIPLRDDGVAPTDFQKKVEDAAAAGQGRDALVTLAEEFRAGPLYVTDPQSLPFDLAPVTDFLERNRQKAVKDIDLKKELEDLYKRKLDKITTAPEFLKAVSSLADTILADALAGGSRPEVVVPFKLLFLFKAVFKGTLFVKGDDPLGRFITGSVVLIPALKGVRPEPEEVVESPPSEPPPDDRRDTLKRLLAAHRELAIKVTDERFRLQPGPESGGGGTQPPPGEGDAPALPDQIDPASFTFILSPEAFAGLSAGTKQVLADLGLGATNIRPIPAVKRIEDEITFLQAQLGSTIEPRTLVMLGGVTIDKNRFRQFLDLTRPEIELAAATPHPRCEFRAGVGDLLMVKQKIKAYEAAEFAHVENVLAGEVREREHRRLDVREEITVEETENEREEERDLQSTERNELQNEADKTVKDQFALEAGLQVSGSYGPSISFTSHLNASFATSSEETQRQASSYSREVTEKTAERVRERVRREQRLRTLSEIQEINRHAINNGDASKGHIRGIYRWLNKVYDAQVFNYGQRMMYEFILPEPAAFLIHALVENPPKEQELIKPEPPSFAGKPLKPANLTRENYHDYVSAFEVTGAPPPPSQFTVVTFFEKQDGKETQNIGRAAKIKIPPGYSAFAVTAGGNYTFQVGKKTSFHVSVGGLRINHTGTWKSTHAMLPERYRGEIGVGLSMLQVQSFAAVVDVLCDLTDEGLAVWQHKVFDLIMQAFLKQKADYDDKVAALQVQKGAVTVVGRNPLENRKLERDELKKLIVMLLRNQATMDFNSFLTTSGAPIMDLAQVCENGKEIQFFESAFEWNNILYVLHPYFWGRNARWISALHFTDPDPDFGAFLRAGAARVQVPVRPGFERAVAHYCQFGTIWEGGEPPLMGDNLYVPIVDEISENLGKLDDGVPFPPGSKPWEVRVPTSLVLLQDLDEVSGIRDVLTGKPLDITP
jgi:hypothetical protein